MDKLVLVINSGSSSLKFALIEAETGRATLSGLGECFGLPEANVSWKIDGKKQKYELMGLENHHQQAVDRIVLLLEEQKLTDKIVAVGHRVVHGGEYFTKTARVDESVMQAIEDLSDLAPLHNKAHVIGMRATMKVFANLPQFAIFDTAFHQTMPAKAYMYGISQELYKQYHIRRYGFHGTSHYYVSREAAKMLDKAPEELNVITAHLGNGASVCAIKDGQSIDTSMGFTPQSGLMMGTRCGELDPSIVEFLLRKGMSVSEIDTELTQKGGFLGISQLTSDCRGVTEAMEEGNENAKLAFDMFTYRVAKTIASYMVPLGRVDAVIFTGGIGENSLPVREAVMAQLAVFGYKSNAEANAAARFGQSGVISEVNTPMTLVIPTNEEFVIARQCVELL
jgi:acetate kinase